MKRAKVLKAIVLRGINDYSYCDISRPTCDKDGILIKVKACGLCGSDIRNIMSGHRNIKYPWVIGHEVSGIVEECGPDYKGELREGDSIALAPPVYCGNCQWCIRGRFELCMNMKELAQHWEGGFAEYMAIPIQAIERGCMVKIDDTFNKIHAAVAEPCSSCINAHEKLDTKLGDSVLIIGAGPIGCIHICLAFARGAQKVYVADISDYRLEYCKRFGDVETINSKDIDLIKAISEKTNGLGVDIVITANSVGQTQIEALEIVKKGGRVAFFGGLPHGKNRPLLDTNLIHYKALSIIGTTNYAPKHYIQALELIESGTIPADKLISHTLNLEDFDKGLELATSGKAMKIVFTM